MVSARVRCFALGCLLSAVSIPAWPSDLSKRTAELAELASWLPGRYESQAAPAGGISTQLQVVRIYAPLLSNVVFYVQESASNDPRRMLAQNLIAFDAIKKVGIVQRSFVLTEPSRWRGGAQSPELFTSLVASDMALLAGCELFWKRTADRFFGVTRRGACRRGGGAAGGAPAPTEIRATLTAYEFAQGERRSESPTVAAPLPDDAELNRYTKR